MQRRFTLGFSLVVAAFLSTAVEGQHIHRQSFEGKQTSLRLGISDGSVKLLEHGLSFERVHSGKQAERIVVRIGSGTFSFIEYPIQPARVFDELSISARLHSSRPGVAIAARVVLPREIDDKTQQPVVTLLRGDVLEEANRWRRLDVKRITDLLEKRQQLMQAEKRRTVDIREAYVDRILFDVFTGLGDVEVYVDDIQVGPIVAPTHVGEFKDEEPVPLDLRGEGGQTPKVQRPPVRDRSEQARAIVRGNQLLVGDRPFFLRGIRWTEAPLETLQQTGFNALFADWPMDPKMSEQADKLGLQLVPMLPLAPVRQGGAVTEVAPDDRVLAYFIGGECDRRSEPLVQSAASAVRSRSRGRPLAGDAREGLRAYSNLFDMPGVYRFPLLSSLELPAYQRWMAERRNLLRPGSYAWTWIQAHVPDDYAQLVYGHTLDQRFEVPVGPQPEQIRLVTYAALAAGYRGIVYSFDRAISVAMKGRDRHLQLALLNLELKLIETFVAEGQSPTFARTSDPNVAAAVFRHKRAVLVLPYWIGPQSQYVVGQASLPRLQVVVENAPEASHAFQITLGDVRSIPRRRDLGGIRLTIPEFDTCAMVVLTSDATLFAQFQELVQQMGYEAAAWQRELAEIQLQRTEEIAARLETLGDGTSSQRATLLEARRYLDESRAAFEQREYRLSLTQSMRSLRFVRVVQHELWRNHVKGLSSPVADPYAVAFYTLPESRQFQASLRQARFSPNRVPSGNFEAEGNLDALGWTYNAYSADRLEGSAFLVRGSPKEGARSLELKLAAREQPPLVLENSLVEMVSPPVKVETGQVVRIRGYVRVPRGITGSVDGAMVWDSLGGEALALRYSEPGDWKEFVLYRPVTRPTEVRVHLVVTGLGTAQFDDVRVEVSDNAMAPLAGRANPNPVR